MMFLIIFEKYKSILKNEKQIIKTHLQIKNYVIKFIVAKFRICGIYF